MAKTEDEPHKKHSLLRDTVELSGVASVPHIITEEEAQQLAESLTAIRGDAGYTSDEFTSLVLWATGAKLAYNLFLAVIDGSLDVDIDPSGEPVFHKPEPNPIEFPREDADA